MKTDNFKSVCVKMKGIEKSQQINLYKPENKYKPGIYREKDGSEREITVLNGCYTYSFG